VQGSAREWRRAREGKGGQWRAREGKGVQGSGGWQGRAREGNGLQGRVQDCRARPLSHRPCPFTRLLNSLSLSLSLSPSLSQSVVPSLSSSATSAVLQGDVARAPGEGVRRARRPAGARVGVRPQRVLGAPCSLVTGGGAGGGGDALASCREMHRHGGIASLWAAHRSRRGRGGGWWRGAVGGTRADAHP
jgi:hypothetical protein